MANTSFNPNDTSRAVGLSGSNLTLTATAGDRGARAVDGFSTGKYYIEYTYTTITNTDTGCGFGMTLEALGVNSSLLGGITVKSGNVWVASAPRFNIGTNVNGDVICWAIDLDHMEIWCRRNAGNWNNNVSADPATNTGGFSISGFTGPILPYARIGASGDTVVANFGDSAFAQAVPSGFTSGWPSPGVTIVSQAFGPVKSAGITLSGSNFKATASGASNGAQVNYSRSLGKFYFEWDIGTNTTGYSVGFMNPDNLSYSTASNDLNAIIYRPTGVVRFNNATQATYDSYTSGNVVRVALDLDNNEIWFAVGSGNWNGSGAANPATNTGGLSISTLTTPMSPTFISGANGDFVTLNTGAAGLTYGVPSGFVGGWPVAGVGPAASSTLQSGVSVIS